VTITSSTASIHQLRTQPIDRARPHGSILGAAIASEWSKLRSVRSTVWGLLATFGMTVGFGLLFTSAYVGRYDRLSLNQRLTFDPTAQSLRGLFLSALAIGVLGVLVTSSEYATGTIRATLAAVPQRQSVLTAKAVTFGAVALAVALVSSFAAFFAGQAVLAGKHIGVSITDPHVLRAVIGAAFYLAASGLLGLALGAILRSTASAISTLVSLLFVLFLLAQALPDPWNSDVGKFLPGRAGAALFTVRPDSSLLSPGTALIVLIAWLVAAYALAAVFLARRDA
jgi:ABC-type transport system involved in multi-copper enzyme maturation permease subunit